MLVLQFDISMRKHEVIEEANVMRGCACSTSHAISNDAVTELIVTFTSVSTERRNVPWFIWSKGVNTAVISLSHQD